MEGSSAPWKRASADDSQNFDYLPLHCPLSIYFGPVNLQQFRYLREAVRQKMNLTEAAKALHTSQPGVSKAIIELEVELGLSVFARHGKRILGLTPPGQQVLDAAERIMNEIDNLKKLARDYAGSPEGTLRLATTHTQARYVLPPVVQRFAEKFPQVRVKLLQGNPAADRRHAQRRPGRHRHGHRDTARRAGTEIHSGVSIGSTWRCSRPSHPLAKLPATRSGSP